MAAGAIKRISDSAEGNRSDEHDGGPLKLYNMPSSQGETTNDLFGFLTTEPSEAVAPIHPKAMPVILTTKEEIETWLTAPTEEALKLQRPFDGLEIVARGVKKDSEWTTPEN
jgi:putative SOS response-associated peptidase YedK